MARRITVAATTALVGLATLISAQDFRPGRPALPAVALGRAAHGEEAIAALAAQLPGVAAHYGMTSEQLSDLLRKDGDLWVDRQARLFYAESHLPDPALAPAETQGTVVGAALVPVDQTFTLHSRPSATKKIYLDFDGHTTTGTSWSDYTDGDSTFVTPPYDFDGVPSSFSTLELERIQYIWQRVAEDYAPFDVDVTTEDPGVEGLRKTTTSDVNYGIRVCIGGASQDWFSTAGYGGVAYLGSFRWNSDTPCYVWENNLGNGDEKNVAEAISHEVGHTLDLRHDGTSTTGYYQGHGTGADAWAPIMGVGYYKTTVQFSRGEYLDANNLEDDLAMITVPDNIPYIADDHGNSAAAATLLASGNFFTEGLIERNTDVDYFRINAGAGNIVINIGVDTRAPNLNVEATLFDSAGNIVGFSSPAATLSASLSLSAMPAGTYYLRIDGVGSGDPLSSGYSGYASIGSYSVSGTAPNAGAPTAVATATTPTSGLAPLTVTFSSAGSTDPDGGSLTYAWVFGNGLNSTEANPSTTYSTPGTYSAVLTVTDSDGFTASATVVITVQGVPPEAPTGLAAAAASSTRVDLSWMDVANNETGFKIERSVNAGTFTQIATVGANATTYADTTVTGGNTYTYRVRASNAYGDSAYSGTASATTPLSPPAAPTSLSARAVSKTAISLTWRDNATTESSYYVECLNGSVWKVIAILGANVTSYQSTGLTANTTYYYRVRAYNAAGFSAYSNTASTKTKR